MLDLASEELVSVPDVQPPEKLLEAIKESGKGDIVLDSRFLILVRGATSRQAEDGPADLVKVVKIGSNLPETVTVTTAEGRQYLAFAAIGVPAEMPRTGSLHPGSPGGIGR